MDRSLAIFVAATSLAVSVFLGLAAVYLGQEPVSEAEDALFKGIWVGVGACLVVAFCASLVVMTHAQSSGEDT